MMKIFVLISLGTTVRLNLYYAGLTYTSPTVVSALSNVILALTFLIAFLLRMEKVKISSARGRTKVVDTIICIVGSLALLPHCNLLCLPSPLQEILSYGSWTGMCSSGPSSTV